MTIPIRSLILGEMRVCAGFSAASDDTPPPVEAHVDGELVGWYQNPEPWPDSIVLFSTEGIVNVEGGGTRRLRFDEMVGLSLPKAMPEGVAVKTNEGDVFVRMIGWYGPENKYLDAYVLVRVLNILCSMLAKPS